MIPVFSLVGSKSNVGKTTVLCKLIRILKSRGYRVATIKHDVHKFDIDHEGKDTWLHAEAGADIVAISSPEKLAIIEKVQVENTLDDVIAKIQGVDIIITEGFKGGNKPKIEVFRSSITDRLASSDDELIGLVTDSYFDKEIPQFNFDEIDKLADFVEDKFLKQGGN